MKLQLGRCSFGSLKLCFKNTIISPSLRLYEAHKEPIILAEIRENVNLDICQCNITIR